ncbi:MAG TPA: O-antigen ligase family protein, partial [Opitutus sp.]|nr:O-antigen ligase family protein [Opitutus sp.]
LFGDMWKFGIGLPLTYAAILLAALLGRVAVIAAALALCGLHFTLDFRSAAGLCLLLAAGTALQLLPARARRFALPLGAALAVLLVVLYAQARLPSDAHRRSRSDIERSAMMTAAWEAFVDSPLLGHGSWFSRSNVYENFLMIRAEAAHEAHIGGFAGPNDATADESAFHSQILVALAEGGLFGGAFFFAFGVGLVRALHRLVFTVRWRRSDPAAMFYLLSAAWNLVMSPFSGAHRVYIATSVGLILLVQSDASRAAKEATP